MPPFSLRPATQPRTARATLIGACAALLLAAPARPAGAQVLAQVSPVRLSLTARPGAPLRRDLQVANFGDSRLAVRVQLSDWDLGADGELSFLPAGSMQPSLAGVLRFAPAEFTLEPNESRWVHLEFILPGTGPATRWGILRCRARAIGADSASRAGAELATTVFISRVPSDSINAAITGIELAPLGADSVRVTARVRNLGARQFEASPEFALADSSGRRFDGVIAPGGVVLPGGSRLVSWVRDRPLLPGRYSVSVALAGPANPSAERVTLEWPPAAGRR